MSADSKSKELSECTAANTPRWNFAGVKTDAKVVSVYDGDTITVAFNTFGLGFFLHSIRLFGIDTPEMRGKTAEEKAAAIAARDFLRTLLIDKIVFIEIQSTDKYGRLLAKVCLSGNIDISGLMITLGFAKPYFGGAKEEF